MSAAKEIIEALVAAGMEPSEAATLFARAVIETTVSTHPPKSPGAVRQQRYRERQGVTKRNESVTERNGNETSQNVTKRNESVTTLRSQNPPISYLLTSSNNLEDKKESKKERIKRKRNAPLPDDWRPPERAYALAKEHGTTVPFVEGVFRDYLLAHGKSYPNPDAAFCNFIRNQSRFGKASHGKAQDNPRAGSLLDSIEREIAELAEEPDSEVHGDNILSLPHRPIQRSRGLQDEPWVGSGAVSERCDRLRDEPEDWGPAVLQMAPYDR